MIPRSTFERCRYCAARLDQHFTAADLMRTAGLLAPNATLARAGTACCPPKVLGCLVDPGGPPCSLGIHEGTTTARTAHPSLLSSHSELGKAAAMRRPAALVQSLRSARSPARVCSAFTKSRSGRVLRSGRNCSPISDDVRSRAAQQSAASICGPVHSFASCVSCRAFH